MNKNKKKNNTNAQSGKAESFVNAEKASGIEKAVNSKDGEKAAGSIIQPMIQRDDGDGEIFWNVHPRPQMRRESFDIINGEWELVIPGKKLGSVDKYRITLPFVPQSKLSNVNRFIKPENTIVYSKRIKINKPETGRVLLHFGAVDRICRVYLNSYLVGEHKGGYIPFEYDITQYLISGENDFLIEADDNTDADYPYGKQKLHPGGMWYSAISGIWQSVWLERVPDNYIKNIKVSTKKNAVTFRITGGDKEKRLNITTQWGTSKLSFEGDEYTFELPGGRFWSPDDPFLYNYVLECGEDKISGYFALRDIEIKESHIYLNGKPLYLNALLYQEYNDKGIFLPEKCEDLEKDVILTKKMGFNALRVHIKIEPLAFYGYCDKHGVLVMQDLVQNGKYSFFYDSLLPTVGLKRLPRLKRSREQVNNFVSQMKETSELLYSLPSVVYYTIFNEGWGQFSEKQADVYSILKEICGNRIIDTASGWFKRGKTDVESDHIYFGSFKKIRRESGKPNILSEFGGIVLYIKEHSFGEKKFGYKSTKTPEEFFAALEKLYTEKLIPEIEKGLSGSVLTQFCDVEEEKNGLLTYDREVVKVNIGKMKKLSDKVQNIFNKTQKTKEESNHEKESN